MTGSSPGGRSRRRPSRRRPDLVRLPPHRPGLRIGLLGGSFDPAHAGHRALSLKALRKLRLDRIWWLVTPGNPLKGAPSRDYPARLAGAARVARHPRIVVSGLEAAIGTTFTVDTLRWLVRHAPRVRFVWLMGADSLAGFHRWRDWTEIAASLPIAVADRPRATRAALVSPAARRLARWRLPEREAPGLAARRPPALVFLSGPRVELSSTGLRASLRERSS
ncbi:MAG: nicotinate-nucleotide adenylyltransferase [Bauldia sp.]|nr:nicotinate-nucleotide adenylyltransferase [Bauldia sp.]